MGNNPEAFVVDNDDCIEKSVPADAVPSISWGNSSWNNTFVATLPRMARLQPRRFGHELDKSTAAKHCKAMSEGRLDWNKLNSASECSSFVDLALEQIALG